MMTSPLVRRWSGCSRRSRARRTSRPSNATSLGVATRSTTSSASSDHRDHHRDRLTRASRHRDRPIDSIDSIDSIDRSIRPTDLDLDVDVHSVPPRLPTSSRRDATLYCFALGPLLGSLLGSLPDGRLGHYHEPQSQSLVERESLLESLESLLEEREACPTPLPLLSSSSPPP